MPMTSFRRISVQGPDIGGTFNVWEASLNLGYPFNAVKEGPVTRNHSIRLLLQAAKALNVPVSGGADVSFHQPLLLSAAATAYDLGESDETPVIQILSARFTSIELEPTPEGVQGSHHPDGRYSELHLVPLGDWPDQTFSRDAVTKKFEATAPQLRATRGAIRVASVNPKQAPDTHKYRNELTTRLTMDWTPTTPGRVKIFGCLQINTQKTLNPIGKQKASAIAFDLSPEGVEFDAWVPNPFADTQSMLEVRLRLVAVQRHNHRDLRLDLIGGSESSLKALWEGLTWMSRDLAARGGNIVLQIDMRGIPPLSWPLSHDKKKDSYSCAIPTMIPEVLLRDDAIGVKLLTRVDAIGDAPGVAELMRPTARLPARAPGTPLQLSIESSPEESTPVSSVSGPKIILSWDDIEQNKERHLKGNPDRVQVDPFVGTVSVEPLAARLSSIWGRSGAIPEKSRPGYAFMALERGWMQIPLPVAPPEDAPKPQRASTALATFSGFVQVDVPLSSQAGSATPTPDGAAMPGLTIAAASGLSIRVGWNMPFTATTPRTVQVEMTDAFGALDGVLWAGEGSPSALEILPPRDAGPAALCSVAVVFGGRDTPGWNVKLRKIDGALPASITFTLPVVTGLESNPPLLVWGAHSELALVSSMAMTRTAPSALRPSATRELVPTQLPDSGELDLSFVTNKRLPQILLYPKGTSVHGDGRWRWPWPQQFAVNIEPYLSSPSEQPGVALASLTLPGVEFTLAKMASAVSTHDMLVSLRFDLPLLDELFATTRAPESSARPADEAGNAEAQAFERPPTALDLRRLSDFWYENAQRSAQARTEADRVVLHESKDDDGKVTSALWHALEKPMDKAAVRGLVEPYVWNPTTFVFKVALRGQPLSLGSYCLGEDNEKDWYSGSKALGGLAGTFAIDKEKLVRDRDATDIKVDGFASSSFELEGQLHDARGLSLARVADTSSAAFTARHITERKEPADQLRELNTQRLKLITLSEPIKFKIEKNTLQFWFRDLPMKPLSNLVFDNSGGLETGLGPDPQAINRDRIARTLYEWRFYPEVNPPVLGQFEFPLAGPLMARPLRLKAFEMKNDGTPLLLELVVAVKLSSLIPANRKGMVFAEEDAYASGNLVLMTFNDNAGVFGLQKVEQVQVGDKPGIPFPPSTAQLLFHAKAIICSPSETSGTCQVPITFGLSLTYNSNAIAISSASLALRLFGQGCRFELQHPHFDEGSIVGTCTGNPGDSTLQLKAISLRWPTTGEPQVTLIDAQLRAPLRADDAAGPFVFQRNYATGEFCWLGLGFSQTLALEEIDHDAGVVRIKLNQIIGASSLFRGFHLPQGNLRGVIAFVFKRTNSADTVTWPVAKLGSAFVEFAFDAGQSVGVQRIKSIRHRHVGSSGNHPVWSSSFLLDAEFPVLNKSTIAWPIGAATVGNADFDPDPEVIGEWRTTLTMTPTQELNLEHHVRPRLCAHELPLTLLVQERDDIALSEPWRFRAVVEHTLAPADGKPWPGNSVLEPLEWTSIDQLCLFDMPGLVRDAKVEFDAPGKSSGYAFMARYQAGKDGAQVRIASVVGRALAQAGFPVRAILLKLYSEYHNPPKDVPQSLLLTGSSLIEAVTDKMQSDLYTRLLGVTFVPTWILPWAQLSEDEPSNIGSLKACPQVASEPRTYSIAAYDAAAQIPQRLDGPVPLSFSVQDGMQSLVEARFANAIATPAAAHAPDTMAVDQAFFESIDTKEPDPLSQPLFVHTLLALKTVVGAYIKAKDPRQFGRDLCCVAASHGLPRREVRFTVIAWPRVEIPIETQSSAVSLLVADESTVVAESLPVLLAAALSESASNELGVQGGQRADAALRALSFSATPRIVMLARVDPSYLQLRDGGSVSEVNGRTTVGNALMPMPHSDWQFVEIQAPGLVGKPPVTLRDRALTLHASPALGWPTAQRMQDFAQAHAHLGDEEIKRNESRSWAGRVRSLAWSAYAWELPDNGLPLQQREEMEEGAFIAMGQRTALRRRAAFMFCSPPDRLAVLAPPRARAPTPQALAAAFAHSRNPDEKGRSKLAPLLPGQVEITVTGQRPGAMFTQHEGILLTWRHQPFDPEFARFGRPAARGPLIARQLRAPRSSALPEDTDLDLRRKTFVASDEIEGGGLKPFKLIKGPAVVVRYILAPKPGESQSVPGSVTLSVDSPQHGWLSNAWDGKVRLIATVPAGLQAHIGLARIGLIPPKKVVEVPPPCVNLQVADVVVQFAHMTWSNTFEDTGTLCTAPDDRRLFIEFHLADTVSRKAISDALHNASADTVVRFTIRGTTLPQQDDIDPETFGEQTLVDKSTTNRDEDLISGPAKVIVFDFSHIPSQRRWLALTPFTLCFADPAYDRELGSPTKTGSLAIANVPHTLAVDRSEYDPGATIHLAFWKDKKGVDAIVESWELSIKAIPKEGGTQRSLGLAGTRTNAIKYRVRENRAYAIPISGLREVRDDAVLDDVPAKLSAGDRLSIVLNKDSSDLRVDVRIVADSVVPPPGAAYGLVTLHTNASSVNTALFATAPLPQIIDFPDLLNDLVAGHVRRRGLFLWQFISSNAPAKGQPFASLVKIDRTGGGQQPDGLSDFASYES